MTERGRTKGEAIVADARAYIEDATTHSMAERELMRKVLLLRVSAIARAEKAEAERDEAREERDHARRGRDASDAAWNRESRGWSARLDTVRALPERWEKLDKKGPSGPECLRECIREVDAALGIARAEKAEARVAHKPQPVVPLGTVRRVLKDLGPTEERHKRSLMRDMASDLDGFWTGRFADEPEASVPIDPRAVEWGLDGGVRPEWVVSAALDHFLALDVNDQVCSVEDVMARLKAAETIGRKS